MKNIKKTLSALVLSAAVLATAQVAHAAMDTGLGAGLGGAVIGDTTGGFQGLTTGNGSADLNFTGDSWVKWNSLNLNSGETLNFNAVDGASGLTILNTVRGGMSEIHGNINANDGIAKLIISNPNGMLFDGCHFTVAGDLLLTADPMKATFDESGNINAQTYEPSRVHNYYYKEIKIKNSDFNVGGEYSIVAPVINISDTHVKVGAAGFKLTTTNGQDYVAMRIGEDGSIVSGRTLSMGAVVVDGDVYITQNGNGGVYFHNGGTYNGNVTINSDDAVVLNNFSNGKTLDIKGNLDVNADGVAAVLHDAEVGGHVNMTNGGGFIDIANVNVAEDMNLSTANVTSENQNGYKHIIRVHGNNTIGGNLAMEAKDNIQIGNYDGGKLTVEGNLTAHAQDGHVAVTSDTSAKNIVLRSDNLNILTDGKAVLDADTYEFYSKGYIGGLTTYQGHTLKEIVDGYIFVPETAYLTSTPMIITGGTITNIVTPGNVNIKSLGDLTVTNATVNDAILTATGSTLDISSENIHAHNIWVGKGTDNLKIALDSRDFDVIFNSIRSGADRVTKISGDQKVDYELANSATGLNIPVNGERENGTVYVIAPTTPEPHEGSLAPSTNAPSEESAKLLRNVVQDDVLASAQESVPTAFAADLDDEDASAPVRQNVDGSVTILKSFAIGK
ncbi:filamentous hemagglutinin N-terminal domain-containing protein [bacterium]|nr:filamentous hemagglutinin N-terminal domain-containing protein [bacterium]MBR1776822.1 filamentous hemagglutinin N-terminal domain-containing protein [bacterium]